MPNTAYIIFIYVFLNTEYRFPLCTYGTYAYNDVSNENCG